MIDSILSTRRLHFGLISSHQTKGRVLPYGHFFTRLFFASGLDLSQERDREDPHYFDTLDHFTISLMRKGVGDTPQVEDWVKAQHGEDEFCAIEDNDDTQVPLEDDLEIPPLHVDPLLHAAVFMSKLLFI